MNAHFANVPHLRGAPCKDNVTDAVREIMEALRKRVTDTELARSIGVTRPSIYGWRHGIHEPSLTNLAAIAHHYGAEIIRPYTNLFNAKPVTLVPGTASHSDVACAMSRYQAKYNDARREDSECGPAISHREDLVLDEEVIQIVVCADRVLA